MERMPEDIPEVDVEEIEELADRGEEDMSDDEITSKIKVSVRNRFDFPTWLLVFEFANREGRRADALALNTRPSRNFPLVGFEFKASRSDWLEEKKDHEKADFFVQLCDEWYVVAGRRGIIKEEELPDGWGLLELKPKGGLWKLVESDLNEMQDTEVDRRFYVRFMKKAMGEETNFGPAELREAERRGFKRGEEHAEEMDYDTKRYKEKAETVDKLEDAGLFLRHPIDETRVNRLKGAENLLKSIEEGQIGGVRHELERLEENIERRMSQIIEKAESMQENIDALEEALRETSQEE